MNSIKKFFLRFYHMLYNAYEGFIADNGYLNASALSYLSLLAIVPVLAVAFGIAKGFGFEKSLEDLILENFYQQPQFAQKLIDFAHSTLEHAHGSLIAGIGAVALFWTAFGLLGNFEKILNSIWKINEMRPWARRLPDYLAVLVLSPLFIVLTGSLILFVMTKIVEITANGGIYSEMRFFIYAIYYLFLLAISWTFFTFIFYFVPNKQIPFEACLVAGIISGTLFQIIQWSYIHFQVLLTSYNAIYGSFAAIPLFLVWLQLSWLVTLIGGEISYYSTRAKFTFSQAGEREKEATEKDLGLLICLLSAERILKGDYPISLEEISHNLKIPLKALEVVGTKLVDGHLLNKIPSVNDQREVFLYQPARPLKQITLADIYFVIGEALQQKWPMEDIKSIDRIKHFWEKFLEERNSPSNLSLNQLLLANTKKQSGI